MGAHKGRNAPLRDQVLRGVVAAEGGPLRLLSPEKRLSCPSVGEFEGLLSTNAPSSPTFPPA